MQVNSCKFMLEDLPVAIQAYLEAFELFKTEKEIEKEKGGCIFMKRKKEKLIISYNEVSTMILRINNYTARLELEFIFTGKEIKIYISKNSVLEDLINLNEFIKTITSIIKKNMDIKVKIKYDSIPQTFYIHEICEYSDYKEPESESADKILLEIDIL